jgi:hypothetical protein
MEPKEFTVYSLTSIEVVLLATRGMLMPRKQSRLSANTKLRTAIKSCE